METSNRTKYKSYCKKWEHNKKYNNFITHPNICIYIYIYILTPHTLKLNISTQYREYAQSPHKLLNGMAEKKKKGGEN